ncbi:MAG: discoidin domain-containing protein [Limisphaerales bacterium]
MLHSTALSGPLLCLVSLGAAVSTFAQDVALTLDPAQAGRTFEGIGCLSAGASSRLLIDYPETARRDVLDLLFKPNYGAGFQHLKVEIGGDVNSTDGVEPSHMRTRNDENYERGYEWWLMKEAKRRNPRILLDCLEWGAPAWIGNGHFNSPDNADYIAKFILGAKRVHGLDIDYTGLWNETRADVAFAKRLRQTLDRQGLQRVQIVAMDDINRWQLVEVMKTDAELAQAVEVVGVHYPKYQSTPAARECGKRIWASEDGPWKGNWEGAAALARMYNRNYVEGRMTKTIIWSPVTSYYDNLPLPGSGVMRANEPWSGRFETQPALWATAHTTQFAAPGWTYLDGACQVFPGGGSCVALRSPNGTDYSLIVETIDATQRIEVGFAVVGGLSAAALQVWRSTGEEQFVRQAEVPVKEGRFTFGFEPGSLYSLTTTSGQQKGAPASPIRAPFPNRYSEDFEGYNLGATPRFFADQAGVFEVARTARGKGRSLQQVVTQKGIEWPFHLNPMPETFLGSPAWGDYEVKVAVLLEGEGFVQLFGRVGRIPQSASLPDAYALKVDQDGYWELGTATVALASGRQSFALNRWHELALRFQGDEIHAAIDGEEVANLKDSTYPAGMVGVGCGWHRAQFDDLSIAVEASDANLALGYGATASSQIEVDSDAGQATDGNFFGTRWSAARGRTAGEWFEVELRHAVTFNTVTLRQYEDRITGYRLEWWDSRTSAWTEAAAGGRMGLLKTERFPAVTSSRVRLVVTAATEAPSLWEFEVRRRP